MITAPTCDRCGHILVRVEGETRCLNEHCDAYTAAERVDRVDLARQLVEHPRWPGAGAGMLVWEPTCPDLAPFRLRQRANALRTLLPDLDDHATQGVLLGMLREVVTPTELMLTLNVRSVEVDTWEGGAGTGLADCRTLGEALARALLAAWGET